MTPTETPTEPDIRSGVTAAPIPDEPDDDDRLIGRVLSRREVLALMGVASVGVVVAACAPGSVASGTAATATSSSGATAAGATATGATASAVAVASSLPSCVVVPELTEGPYYVNENLDRSDIRVDTSDGSVSAGNVLTIDWVVSQVDGNACIPLEGVLVDVWHCDALGNYSDVGNEQGHNYLRGYQHTDANGRATITTIYPGWYQGRAVHIHFKIRTDATASKGLEFTSQLFFDDTLNDQVFSQGAYASKGKPDVQNAADGIYQQSQGMTILKPVKDGDGYKATFELAMQTT
jgi:protocatechuate 3,4-dioxygenase beta subunit